MSEQQPDVRTTFPRVPGYAAALSETPSYTKEQLDFARSLATDDEVGKARLYARVAMRNLGVDTGKEIREGNVIHDLVTKRYSDKLHTARHNLDRLHEELARKIDTISKLEVHLQKLTSGTDSTTQDSKDQGNGTPIDEENNS